MDIEGISSKTVYNGRVMAYIDEGSEDGRTVLLLSGNTTWGFLYRDFVPVLTEAGYRAIAPDWVGAGYSDHPRVDAALTLAHHIADLVSLPDQLGLRDFVIVGQDWGGPQGVGAALQRVERLGALVLMNIWLFTDYVGRLHSSPFPWTTWLAPITGQFFTRRSRSSRLTDPPPSPSAGCPMMKLWPITTSFQNLTRTTWFWPGRAPYRCGKETGDGLTCRPSRTCSPNGPNISSRTTVDPILPGSSSNSSTGKSRYKNGFHHPIAGRA
ncbi:MAG: alpha/beta fold hydrolase [Deltaproteobacteria bacterium]|nr:alpha/beta fold hydrolase [Deltaproteobacteria bacterium]